MVKNGIILLLKIIDNTYRNNMLETYIVQIVLITIEKYRLKTKKSMKMYMKIMIIVI